MNKAHKNPYNGSRSFQAGQQLYGRDREIRDLTGLLVAERIVLLHSPCGAGKTSLVQAGLMPRLRAMDFGVPPPLRVSLRVAEWPANIDATAVNRYLLSLLLSLETSLPVEAQYSLEQLIGLSFDDYLRARDEAGELVLIFDQFEELFTLDATDRAAKHTFFVEVGKALRERRRWALFSLREDYIASLNPYLQLLPDRLRTSFRLDFLQHEAAYEAVKGPAAEQHVTFSAEAAHTLIHNLSCTMAQPAHEVLGQYVEPVPLQVACYRLWNSLPPGTSTIDCAEVNALGDVRHILADYYNDEVAKVAQVAKVREWVIRAGVERALITEDGIRSQVTQAQATAFGLNEAAVQALTDVYLLGAEQRHGSNWLELAHERLIDPIRESNATWFEAQLSMLQRQAKLWYTQGQPDSLLLRDTALIEAEIWAAKHPDELHATIDLPFLSRCREQRATEARDRQHQRRLRWLLWGGSGLAAAAIIALFIILSGGMGSLRERSTH